MPHTAEVSSSPRGETEKRYQIRFDPKSGCFHGYRWNVVLNQWDYIATGSTQDELEKHIALHHAGKLGESVVKEFTLPVFQTEKEVAS